MKRHTLLASILVATTALGGAAFAAEHTAPPAAAQAPLTETPAQKAVDRDVIKLSADGAAALRDIGSTRLALFEANPAQAKTLIERARTALDKAGTDDAVFTKAEAALKQPAGAKAPEQADTKAVAWLPVDSQMTLGEDFVATPQKNAAIAEANRSLKAGDQKGAAEKLRLAGVDVNTTVAVLPLAKTTEDVHRAAGLIEQGKYYEANAVLKQAEGRMRFDVADIVMVPDKLAANQKALPAKAEAAQHDRKAQAMAAPSDTGPAATGSHATPDNARAATTQPAPNTGKAPS
ncbi:YfdX family protein [Methylorubrum salsuginis]|uniref:YfdX protein n=1 Tax=Methylorubrum salsuginis TaxID=414703 RepID=A0A1I4E879_9HYPH|nr:YfdX family protein [Methylorubrum salsuginis]SFL02024.1 YfdX protein [Methylorubrum salsuginis]